MAKLFIAAGLVVIAVWILKTWDYGALQELDTEEWWGPKGSKSKDTTVREFKVVFSEEMISDLKHRLKNFRVPPPTLEGFAFQYGFHSEQLEIWRQYWADKYNFTERETFFNKFKNYKTNIQGLDIHFVWVKPDAPPGVTVLPLLLLHGWPGSVREFYELIPLLTVPGPDQKFVFEVIVPSLPGFGYSDGPRRPGLGGPQIAVIMRNLMLRLGHRQFYVHAGDWGAEVVSDLATFYPDQLLGFHSNLVIAKHPLALLMTAVGSVFPKLFVEPQLEGRMNRFPILFKEMGYINLQTFKPDTIGHVLSDSPLGLLAYILEKFTIGTNYHYVEELDGGLGAFSREQLLDNLMMYWAPRSIVTSLRLYREGLGAVIKNFHLNFHPAPVPTWVMQAEYEVAYQTPGALRYKFPNLVNVTVLYEGGHFISLEAPEVVAEDVFRAVEAFRKIEKR